MRAFEKILSSIGLDHTIENWELLNYELVKSNHELLDVVLPFPPIELINLTSGLTDNLDFAKHGVDIFSALRRACPREILSFSKVLDFACGCGRVARMMYPLSCSEFHGADIDQSMAAYMTKAYPKMNVVHTKPNRRLPFKKNYFDLIYSISVLSHTSEESQDLILKELSRITSPDGILLISVHSDRAMERTSEQKIFDMLGVDRGLFELAQNDFYNNRHAFILQQGHLTTRKYRYGITFLSSGYIHSHFSKWFNVLDIVDGAIHDFQSIVVLSPKK